MTVHTSYSRNTARMILAGVFLLAGLSGCGSGAKDPGIASVPGATTTAPDRGQQVTRYRKCLVDNGVTVLDQPTEEGLPQIDKNRTPADTVGRAMEACRAQVPAGGDVATIGQADIEARQRYAACIRSNGVPEYPDPDPRTGDPRITDDLAARLKASPKMTAAQEACHSLAAQPGAGGTNG